MPDNPDNSVESVEYTGYIMPVLSPGMPAIVAPFTAENFRKFNDIASNAEVQTSISDITSEIETVQNRITTRIDSEVKTIQEDIEDNKTNIAQLQDAQDVIKGDIVDIRDDIISTITPSIPLGGLTADVALENMTALEILKQMLEKELFSTIKAQPSASLSISEAAEVELGTEIPELTLTASSSRGTYSPYYYKDSSGNVVKGTSHDYAGKVESYTFSGDGISNENETPQTTNKFNISKYTIGTSNSWKVNVLFADGEDIMSSKGSTGTPAKYTDASDTGKTASASITPTFPIYATTSDPSVLTRYDKNVKTSDSHIEVELAIEDSQNLPNGINYNKLAFLVPTLWLEPAGSYKVEVYNEGNGQWEDATENWTEYPSTITWTDGDTSSLTFTGAADTTIKSKTISGAAPKITIDDDEKQIYKLIVNKGGLVVEPPLVKFYRQSEVI